MKIVPAPWLWLSLFSETINSCQNCYVVPRLFTLYFSPTLLSTYRHSLKAHKYGCRPPHAYPHLDPLLELDAFAPSLKGLAQCRLMDDIDERFKTISGGVNRHLLHKLSRFQTNLHHGARKRQNHLRDEFQGLRDPADTERCTGNFRTWNLQLRWSLLGGFACPVASEFCQKSSG